MLKWLSRHRWRVLAVLAVLALGGGAAAWVTFPWPDEVRLVEVDLAPTGATPIEAPTGRAAIQVDCFFPSDNDRPRQLPAVVILHGVEGTSYYRRSHLNNARQIADEGYAVFFVHYFDPLPYENLVYLNGKGELDVERIEVHLYGERKAERQLWIDACAEMVAWVAQQPEVAGDQVTLLGYSLGGFVALSACDQCVMRDDLPDPCAVVVNSAARFRDLPLSKSMPPIQFHHGADDDVVLLRHARKTYEEALANGVTADFCEYAKQGHILTGQAAKECREVTYDYLRKVISGREIHRKQAASDE